MINKVVVNHTERNYFDDYSEIRTDVMSGVEPEKVTKAIDKLVRRFKTHDESDVMFVMYDDDTAYRLAYQTVGMEEYEHPTLGVMYRGGHNALVLRHYTHYSTNSYDTDNEVTAAKAKRLILEGEQE